MAINYDLINGGTTSLSGNFILLSKNPLDTRFVVPALEGLQNLIDNGAAYAGMVTYVTSEKRLYEVYDDNGTLKYRTHAYTEDEIKAFIPTEDELKALIGQQTTAAMEFKGVTATLPENPSNGDMYKVGKVGETEPNITIDGVTAKSGDAIVAKVVVNEDESTTTTWYLIPSGDDLDDTWRPITDVDTDAALTFAAGSKLDVEVTADGNVTYSHETIAAPKLIANNEQTRTYITEVETDGYGHITGYKTATENVEDDNTTYEFECATEHSNVYFTVTEKLNGEEVNTHTVCVDAYTQNETNDKITEAIEALDVTDITGFGAGKTLATLTETDGKIAATFQDIAITESQITDLGDYKTKQSEYSANGSNKQTITSVTQNENGEIVATFEAIDFSHNHDDKYKELQQAVAAVETQANEFIGTISQNEQGVVSIGTKSVDFSPVVGTANDTSADNTVYGAKKYASEQAIAVLGEAQSNIASAVDSLAKIATSGSIYDVAEVNVHSEEGKDDVCYLVLNCNW